VVRVKDPYGRILDFLDRDDLILKFKIITEAARCGGDIHLCCRRVRCVPLHGITLQKPVILTFSLL
jgi:hypothetical protein